MQYRRGYGSPSVRPRRRRNNRITAQPGRFMQFGRWLVARLSEIHTGDNDAMAEYKRRCRELMDGYVNQLRDQRSEQQTETDRQILALASAVLALSVTFVKDIVPIMSAIDFPLLFWSWGLMSASIVSTLTSFYI